MDEKNRIEKIMQSESMTSGQFAQEIGIQNSTLSHIINSRNNPSLDVMKKILSRFPNINADWLILGLGPMFRQEMQSQMPTLFGFEDESNSLSVDSEENNKEKSIADFTSNKYNQLKSAPESPYVPLSPRNVALDNSDTISTSSENRNKKIPDQSIGNKTEGNVNFTIEAPQFVDKKVIKIILYYSDHTFQEFESK
jgi:transcriptional regulator with XRE-family HTH domain